VICRNPLSGSPKIQHYYASGQYVLPSLLDTNNPTLGLSSTSLNASESSFICSFTRQNENANNGNYFNLNTKSPYLIAAYGLLGLNEGIIKFIFSYENLLEFSCI
jgi:hypothetical protein